MRITCSRIMPESILSAKKAVFYISSYNKLTKQLEEVSGRQIRTGVDSSMLKPVTMKAIIIICRYIASLLTSVYSGMSYRHKFRQLRRSWLPRILSAQYMINFALPHKKMFHFNYITGCQYPWSF